MSSSRGTGGSGDRPFPWRCPNCLATDVWPVVTPYTAKVKHDGIEYTIDIPALEIPKCRNCGELLFSNHVDEQIRDALRSRLRLLTPSQIRAGRKTLSLHQGQLAERLGVAAETISRWENGALIQSRSMDNLLRVYFAIPEVRNVLAGEAQDPGLGVEVVTQVGSQRA
jgi:putative zinc finger/helix-turn-helix YgiT family protein